MAEPLFNTPNNITVIAKDLNGKEVERPLLSFKFRASVYGVLRNGDEMLFKRHPRISKFELPGGGVEMDETIEQGLIREFKEETGLDVKPIKLLTVEDALFTHEGMDAHSIIIVYEVEEIGGTLQTNDEDSVEVKYLKISDLSKLNVQWAFLNVVSMLKSLNGKGSEKPMQI